MRSSQQELSRSVNLPEGFPPGFVIGRGGTEIKRMQERYGVRMRVDSGQRRVTVRGAKFGVNASVKELLESFEAFTIKQSGDLLRLHAAVDANNQHWRFEPLPKAAECEDVDLTICNHVLKHAEATEERNADDCNNNHWDKWFNSVQPDDSASIAAFCKPLRQFGHLSEHKVSLVVGETFYELIQTDLSMRWLSSSAMQSYRHGEAFRSRWSNVFDRRTCQSSLRLLVEALEARIQVESLPVTYAMKVFVRNEHRHYDGTLVYYLHDGSWQFKRGYLRTSKAFAVVSIDDDTELRVWVNSRSTPNGKLIQDAKKYVTIDTPFSATPEICAFASSVVMGPDTPADYVLKLTFVVAKYHVVYEGLHFTLAYANRERTKVRLACRSIDRDSTRTCDEEASMLTHRMLTLLEHPPKVQNEQSDQVERLQEELKEDWEEWE